MKTFDTWLLRVLAILVCVWVIYHLRPEPIVQLTTPTKTVVKEYAGLPDAGFRSPGR
jgi:hypothetical protein